MAGLPCTRVDRPLRRRGRPQRAAGPDARLPAAPRLRPAAVRPVRHATWRSSSGNSTTRARRCSTRRRSRRPGVGGQRVRPLRRDAGRSTRTGLLRTAGLLAVRPRAVRREARHVRQPGVRRLRPPARARLRPRPGRRAAGAGTARPAARRRPGTRRRGARRGRLDHERSGEVVLLSEPDAWFAYPFWLDDAQAPDYARTVAIHHKPGYDPCELFFDPKLRLPKLHAARRLLQKKLGFRMTLDVVPLDAAIVRGSHGLPAADPLDRPLLIGHGPKPGGGTADDRRAGPGAGRAGSGGWITAGGSAYTTRTAPVAAAGWSLFTTGGKEPQMRHTFLLVAALGLIAVAGPSALAQEQEPVNPSTQPATPTSRRRPPRPCRQRTRSRPCPVRSSPRTPRPTRAW